MVLQARQRNASPFRGVALSVPPSATSKPNNNDENDGKKWAPYKRWWRSLVARCGSNPPTLWLGPNRSLAESLPRIATALAVCTLLLVLASSSTSSTLSSSPYPTMRALESAPLAPKSKIPFLPIYYMNLEKSKDRRKLIEDMLDDLGVPREWVTRVDARNVTRVQHLLATGGFRLENGIQLLDSNAVDEDVAHKRATHRFDYREGGCLLSHLEALRQAYDDGQPYALILEDDARISPNFVKHWRDYALLAPDDWNLLQWANDYETIYDQGKNLTHDAWIPWMTEHWSARANLYSRKGMEFILGEIHSVDDHGRDIWTLRGEPTLVADELMYFYAKQVYTSTIPWIGRFAVSTTLQEDREETIHVPFEQVLASQGVVPELKLSQRTETILVVTEHRLPTVADALVSLERLRLDADAVCRPHPTSTLRRRGCDWEVRLLVPHRRLLYHPRVWAALRRLPSHVRTHAFVVPDVDHAFSNKFAFGAGFRSIMPSYDLVVFKDADVRTVAFPWDSFLEAKGTAVLASPLRQFPYEGMYKYHYHPRPERPAFAFHDGLFWKQEWHTPWSADLYRSVEPSVVPYLESYLVALDGKFAAWFLSELEEHSNALQKTVPGGPEYLWCAAARQWDPSRPSCHLVPVIARLEEPPRLATEEERLLRDKKNGERRYLEERTLEALRAASTPAHPFAEWMEDAVFWQKTMEYKPLIHVQEACQEPPFSVPGPQSFSLRACLEAVPAARRRAASNATAATA